MLPDPDTCYRALRARDPRFDGVFFVAVVTTGIYCRPVCPARLPARDRCRFFSHPGAAEAAGFRPCLRCRPERAPGRSRVDAPRDLARRAAGRIAEGALDRGGVPELAAELHVGPRQLRRALRREYGASPVQLAQTRRLLLARNLLMQSRLPVDRIAEASGFSSLRRFHALFRERYRMSPGRMRRTGGRARSESGDGTAAPTLDLALDARPPWDADALLGFLRARAVAGVEVVSGDRYLRSVELEGHRGWFSAERAGSGSAALRIRASLALLPVLPRLVARIRHLFDLDAEPDVIREHLGRDPALGPRVRRRPGLRVPGAVDGFELAWRTVLGQQVSVAGAGTLARRFVRTFAEEVPADGGWPEGLVRFPVRAEAVAEAGWERIRAVGVPEARARCIHALAGAVAGGGLVLEPGAPLDETRERLLGIRGIGPWTAEYILMRALHWPDAFPSGDRGLRRALGDAPARDLERTAEAWRPWRAYAALHLWQRPDPPSKEELPCPTS